MITPPIIRVDTPQLVVCAMVELALRFWNGCPAPSAKFVPEKVRRCRPAAPCRPASSPRCTRCRRRRGSARSPAFRPRSPASPGTSSAKSRYTSSIFSVSSRASSAVACAVCPSCHRNSVVRRNMRVRISQRTTLAHWLISTGRSRHDWIQRANVCRSRFPTSGARSAAPPASRSGSGTRPPLPSGSAGGA